MQYKPSNLEVLIAEDNDSEEARTFIGTWKKQLPFPLVHLQQADNGFRKCKVLNEAIRSAKGDYLIFIDGDCLLHPMFIYSHQKLKQLGHAIYGRRVMLSQSITQKLYHDKTLKYLKPWQILFSGCSRLDALWYLPFLPPKAKIGIWGHNWSIHKADIMAVKGFDETYTAAGIGEDTDIEWRLVQTGIKFLRYKNRLIQYHLWHPVHYSSTLAVQEKLASKKLNYQQNPSEKLLLGSL